MALAEFGMKTQKNDKKLKFISLIVGQESKEMLLGIIANAHQSVLKSVNNLILSQTIFTGDKIQKSLSAAPPLKIQQFKINFEETKGKQLPPEEKDLVLKFLDDLAFLRRQSEQLVLTTNLLNKSVPIVSAFDLLKTMFTAILVHMHQNCWGIVSSDK